MNLITDLKAYKEQHDLTLEALAGKLGVSWSTVQRWFKGKMEPSAMAEGNIKRLLKKK